MTDGGVVKQDSYASRLFDSSFDEDFVDRFFGDFPFSLTSRFFGNYKFPESKVTLADGRYKVELEMPGFEKDEIKVSLEDGRLEVVARKETNSQEEKGSYFQREFTSQSYQRTFAVPILVDGIEAKYEKGILSIDAKVDETKKLGKLEIKVE